MEAERRTSEGPEVLPRPLLPIFSFLRGQLLVQFIAALLSCLFLYCRICVVIIVFSALANYK